MSVFNFIRSPREKPERITSRVQLVTERGNGFYAWDGKVYQSDIVRSCIRPFAAACGKLQGKHIRSTETAAAKPLTVNPDAYIRFLLEEPNPYMSGQKLQEKLATQLALNNNAFAVVLRDENDLAKEIYPINAAGAEAIYDTAGTLLLRFTMLNGKTYTFPYSDIIHLRNDFYQNDIFGEPFAPTLAPLMEIVSTTDQGIVKAIKNSSVIRWLLKLAHTTRDEDRRKKAEDFAESFLSVENGTGVAAVDPTEEATQVEPKNYVPNADQMELTTQRIYSLFGTSANIIQSKWTEDEWNSYYEAKIEPFVIDLQNQFTFKLFSRRERGCGNHIVFDASNLSTASMSTKLNLRQMVDLGAMSVNEWRGIMNLPPTPGGDRMIRRKDTGFAETTGAEGGEAE
ncbi:MAG: phage portal protein [Bacillota bacterium]